MSNKKCYNIYKSYNIRQKLDILKLFYVSSIPKLSSRTIKAEFSIYFSAIL